MERVSEPSATDWRDVPLPARMLELPRDHRGFPVPWFVQWQDGKPIFPAFDSRKFRSAVEDNRCWVCGGKLLPSFVFVIGPMCVVNRVTAEPPCHRECAEYSARACPFLSRPRMGRVPTDKYLPEGEEVSVIGGIASTGNPGAAVTWTTNRYHVDHVENGVVIRIGPASSTRWWRHGHIASPEEAAEALRAGCERLMKTAATLDGEEGVAVLVQMIGRARKHLPEPKLLKEITVPMAME
jgi:hypothetical protein